MTTIQNQTFDQERALYGVRDLLVRNCAFDGPPTGRAPLRNAPASRRSTAFSTCATPSGMTTASLSGTVN